MCRYTIVYIIFLMCKSYKNSDSTLVKIWNTLCGIFSVVVFTLIIGLLITVFIGMIGESCLDTEERVVRSYDLVSLDTNEDIEGSYSNFFFIGSGYIGEELYYHFYYKTSKGIKYKKVRAEECYIIETTYKPSYKQYGEFIKDTTAFFYSEGSKRDGRQVLFIPKGTVKSNYKVN